MHTSPMTQAGDITSQLPARDRWLTTVEHAQRAARFGLAIEISGDARPVPLAERLDRLVPAEGDDTVPDLAGLLRDRLARRWPVSP